MKIAIDPGHGMSNRKHTVFDSGATHTEDGVQFREADIALKYGLSLKDVLRARGYEVFLTRDDNTDHAPVYERASNAQSAHCDAYISLHLNDTEDDSARGLEVLYRGEDDVPLASALQDALIRTTGFKDRGIKQRTDLAVLKFNGLAVLIELGFIANDGDRTALLNPAMRSLICESIGNVLEKSVGDPSSAFSGQLALLSKAKVKTESGDALRVRSAPRGNAPVVGSLANGTEVEVYGESGIWKRIDPTDEKWVSGNFITPIVPGVVPPPATGLDPALQRIIQIAADSEVARYDWPGGHHRAPLGYTKGMALAFGRSYCKLLAGDPVMLEVAQAVQKKENVDSIYRLSSKFEQAGLSIQATGADMLRLVYTLVLGLGINESDGKWNEGMYGPDGNNNHDTAEAGIFQTSYNIIGKHANARLLYESYRGKKDPWLPVFQEGVKDNAKGLINHGNGLGVEFQELTKHYPTFAAEMAALRLRTMPGHWAPVRDHYVHITSAADKLFKAVQAEIDATGSCPLLL